MLLGLWKNFVELEESICLDELMAILKASHEQEHRRNKFMAALKGVDIDKGSTQDAHERMEAIKRRVAARQAGVSEETVELHEFGIEFETEE